MTTGKTIALTIWTFVGKVMSLLFNMLSRFIQDFFKSIYFWLCWVFVTVHGFSLVVAIRGYSFYNNFIYLFVFGHAGCVLLLKLSRVVVNGGYSLVEVGRLLVAVASLAVVRVL